MPVDADRRIGGIGYQLVYGWTENIRRHKSSFPEVTGGEIEFPVSPFQAAPTEAPVSIMTRIVAKRICEEDDDNGVGICRW